MLAFVVHMTEQVVLEAVLGRGSGGAVYQGEGACSATALACILG